MKVKLCSKSAKVTLFLFINVRVCSYARNKVICLLEIRDHCAVHENMEHVVPIYGKLLQFRNERFLISKYEIMLLIT
jgi:hypothetical protein